MSKPPAEHGGCVCHQKKGPGWLCECANRVLGSGENSALVQGVIRALRVRMAGIAVRGGNNAFGEPHRTILSFRKFRTCQRGSRHDSPWACERAVSRDGHWSPDRGDSFAKIHSGLVADTSRLAASDDDPVNALAVPIGLGIRISDCGLRIGRKNGCFNGESAISLIRNAKSSRTQSGKASCSNYKSSACIESNRIGAGYTTRKAGVWGCSPVTFRFRLLLSALSLFDLGGFSAP
jgi:hypothetical protein